MRLSEAEQVLIDRVRLTVDAPNVLVPDDPETLDPNRWVIQRSSPQLPVRTMDNWIEATAEILVRVETVEGGFSREHTDLLNLLLDRFRLGARFSGVTVREAPNPRGSFPEGGVYVTPVFIRGRFWQTP